jgi:hypothetical protein
LLTLALAGCQGGPGEQTLIELDSAGYINEVHGYVSVGCATLDCHGNPGRPLRLYSEIGLRESTVRDLPVSASEIEANTLSFAAVDSAPPLQHLAILKPLAESAGGLDHVGGDVWSDVNDPGYICVLACLEGRVSDEQAACAEARSSVMLPPKL